jgi:prepilin-type N-terminal cleavage/methylation domain-containing protein/prepilin-type processing-associated H-X9-DG protein
MLQMSTGMKRIGPRQGFTIIEMLVVIGIIGILIALLIPAVQSTREAARRLQCKNNLKQLGLAIMHHVQVHDQYPTGGWGWYWVGDPDRGFNRQQTGGWFYNILPYLEQNDLHNLPQDGLPNIFTDKQKIGANAMTKTPISLANCPSRRPCITFAKPNSGVYVARNAADNDPDDNVAARGDYAANAGAQGHDEFFAGPETLAEGDSPSYPWHDTRLSNGISFERSEIKPDHIRDGTTNTLMIGEKYLNPDHYATGLEPYDNENLYTGFNNDNFRSAFSPPLQDRRGLSDEFSFGASHTTGCNFTFCDGSVHMLDYTIDPIVFRNLGSRDDGQIIDRSAY